MYIPLDKGIVWFTAGADIVTFIPEMAYTSTATGDSFLTKSSFDEQ